MMNTKTKVALAVTAVLAAGTAQAATTHTMTNGSFKFYNLVGVEETSAAHNDVQGTFDLFNGVGQFTTSTLFNGATWVADVNAITMYSGTGVDNVNYTWTTETWFDTAVITCNVSGALDGCAGLRTGLNLSNVTGSYSYTLSNPGMFGVHTFFDWSTNIDIPVLAVLQVTAGNPMTGPATVASVDSDGDGAPGTAMATAPFKDQTPAFAGVMVPVAAVPVPAAVWLFGSGLLGLVGVARRKKASV